MKRTIALTTAILLAVTLASAQETVKPNQPLTGLSSTPGYITINEFVGGVGLGQRAVPYSKGFFGFHTIHGYQINQSFMVGGGTGIYGYNGGTLVPLFVDFRYRFLVNTFTPFLYGDGGALFGDDTKLFINPGAGVRYSINRNVALNLSTGLWV
jgi:opacity protein-like surface antigen